MYIRLDTNLPVYSILLEVGKYILSLFFNLKTNCFQLGVYSELFNLTLKHLMTIKLQNKLKKQENCLLSGKTCHDCLK